MVLILCQNQHPQPSSSLFSSQNGEDVFTQTGLADSTSRDRFPHSPFIVRRVPPKPARTEESTRLH